MGASPDACFVTDWGRACIAERRKDLAVRTVRAAITPYRRSRLSCKDTDMIAANGAKLLLIPSHLAVDARAYIVT